MIDTPLVMALAALLGARSSTSMLACLVLVAASTSLAWKRLRKPWLLLAALLFAVTSWRAQRALTMFEADRVRARDALTPPSTCRAPAVVSASPRWVGDGLVWSADLDAGTCDARSSPPMRVRLHGGPPDLARGDRLEVTANLAAVQLAYEPDLADPTSRAALSGIVASGGAADVTVLHRSVGLPALIDRARARVRERIVATYPEGATALARALVLGEEDLEPADADAFRTSGLAHLLAVSGAHLVLVIAGLVAALRWLLIRIPWLSASRDVGALAAAIGLVASFLYADFAGSSGSAMRAAAMASVLLGARALGRRSTPQRALGVSLLLLLLTKPLAAFDLSLLLSLAATAGLLALSPAIEALLPSKIPSVARKATSASLSASLACAPFLAAIAPSLPLLGVLANLVAVPVGEAIALPLCLFHALLSPFPPLERGAAVVGGGALLAVRAIARLSSSVSWSAIPIPPPTTPQALALSIGALAFLLAPPGRKLACLALTAAACLLGEGFARHEGTPHDRLRITFLDVGQGDSSLVDFPDGRAMLIDGGGAVGSPIDPGRTVISPLLRARRRSRLDVVVLTHPHPDHFLGLASALPLTDVGELWDNGQGEAEGAGDTYAGLLAGLRARRVPIVRPASLCGAPRFFGGARVDVLAPCPAPHPFAPANDGSIVLRLTYGERAALLVGDAEVAEEGELLAAHRGELRADVLKVGHHGSRTSTSPPFLRAVSPSLAILSTGVRNRFGHPHPSTMATLRSQGVPFARTDRDGAIVWETDGHEISITRSHQDSPP